MSLLRMKISLKKNGKGGSRVTSDDESVDSPSHHPASKTESEVSESDAEVIKANYNQTA